MALEAPGNSHEVKIGLILMKYIQADHLGPVLSLSGPYSGSLRSFYGPIWTKMALFWTNMALKVPGNSHEVKIGLIRGPIAKNGLSGKNAKILAQKKKTHFLRLTMFRPRPGNVVQRKMYRFTK